MIATALIIMFVWAGAVFAAPAPAELGAAPGSPLDALAERLATADTQKDALLALEKIADPAIEPLLRALKDGALYRWKGRLVMLADDASLRDVHGQHVTDEKGAPAALAGNEEPIALEESLFAGINRVLG